MSGKPTYLGVVSSAAAEGLLTGVWVVAGELPPARRRLARAGTVVAVSAAGWATSPGHSTVTRERSVTWSDDRGLVVRDADGTEIPGRRGMVAAGVSAALAVGMTVGRRQVERRWLARLERRGHAHPYRALAVRMAVFTTAVTLSKGLIDSYRTRRK
jgi:hypothetical protein